jgi:phage terminase large subunit
VLPPAREGIEGRLGLRNLPPPPRKNAGSVDNGIEFLQPFDIVVHPECPRTAEELANYSYKIDPKIDEVIPVLEDKNNHLIDALRYALEGTRHSTYNLDALAN